jgi:hypothetical protein
VIEAMNTLIALGETACGYEANGGVLGSPVTQEGRTLAALPTRDAVLPMLAVLAQARRSGLSVSALRHAAAAFHRQRPLAELSHGQEPGARRPPRRGRAPAVLAKVGDLFGSFAGPATLFNQVDGLRITFASGDIIHLRPSGNARTVALYRRGHPRARGHPARTGDGGRALRCQPCQAVIIGTAMIGLPRLALAGGRAGRKHVEPLLPVCQRGFTERLDRMFNRGTPTIRLHIDLHFETIDRQTT